MVRVRPEPTSDTPAVLTSIGVALVCAAIMTEFVSFIELPRPGWPILLLFLAALCFAGGAAIKASTRR